MDNPETQAILGTMHRTETNKTKNGQPRDTGNIGHKTQDEDNEMLSLFKIDILLQ